MMMTTKNRKKYTPPIDSEPIRMGLYTVSYVKKNSKYKNRLKWKKRNWNYVMKRMRFSIYRLQDGRTFKYKLANNPPSFLWDKIGRPGRSSWEIAKQNNFMYFRMLIDGSITTNTIKQRVE